MSQTSLDSEAEYEAAKVRRAIVARYDKGYDEGAEIDDWEDANFIVYKVTDRYGFLHKNPIDDERDAKQLAIERERSLKWVKMIKNWDKYARSEKLRRRIFKGIPDALRGEVWKRMLGVDKLPNRTRTYEKMKDLARQESPDIRQIDLDVNRTYRDHIMFRERYGIKQQALFHVLAAYSMYNTEVGYCQGMSGIAAILLMYLTEEDAFWSLSQLLTDRKHGMHGLFIPGFPKLLRFQQHHDKILKKLLSRLFKQLEREGCHSSLYTLKWFMQCFLDRVPFSLTRRLWDIFILEGDRVLTAMAYNIMKMHRKIFQKMNLEEVVQFLQEKMPSYPYDDDEVIEQLQASMFELKKLGLDTPPPPTRDEIPKQAPGASLTRGTYLTASARARKNREKEKIIRVPHGRPPSPESGQRFDPMKDLNTSRPGSPSIHRSETSVSTAMDTPTSQSQLSMGTVVEIDIPKRTFYATEPRPKSFQNEGRARSEFRQTESGDLEFIGYTPVSHSSAYHSESVLISSSNMFPNDYRSSRQRNIGSTGDAPASYRPINGDVDALQQNTLSTFQGKQKAPSPVWKERPANGQKERFNSLKRRSRTDSQTSLSSISSHVSLQSVTWEASKTNLFGITEL